MGSKWNEHTCLVLDWWFKIDCWISLVSWPFKGSGCHNCPQIICMGSRWHDPSFGWLYVLELLQNDLTKKHRVPGGCQQTVSWDPQASRVTRLESWIAILNMFELKNGMATCPHWSMVVPFIFWPNLRRLVMPCLEVSRSRSISSRTARRPGSWVKHMPQMHLTNLTKEQFF